MSHASGLSIERYSSLLRLHDFTQCDTTSCFKETQKVKPIKVIDKNRSFSVSADLEAELEELVTPASLTKTK